jgi:serine/threonine-protein kinase
MPTSSPSGPSSLDDARFLPGTMLAGRYRIVGLVGKGGMGEVYRADDLKLGQPVALKFLPTVVAGDQNRLTRFLSEVKIARQVSHPNVCRVYDVGEAEGHHYLSMEYVDGEDLATLLKRIGRLPSDKALQIARQLCAGLAAAHEQGILHRDIKPANVMLDGRGRAKLTDFGLAGLAEGIEGAEVRAGTPSYMAPEQLSGRGVSVRSDLYSLGLVLYELFTGKRAFDAETATDLVRLQQESTPPTPSSFMDGFDPAVERVLLQCLDKEPAQRPATALTVAAALPGGDPLAAALAAGETPSPEIVAAAGPQGGLRPGVAIACLAAVVLIWALDGFLYEGIWIYGRLPFNKSYEALKENAREIATRVGYSDSPNHAWAGFTFNMPEYFHLAQEHGAASLGDHVAEAGQLAFLFQHRQAGDPIVSLFLNGRVNWGEPAPGEGEVALLLDLQGHLVELRATPSREESEEEATEVDWDVLFDVAGLDIDRFEPTAPTIRPRNFADTRMAWTGSLPDYGDRPVRIEAAALDGKPVYFEKVVSSDSRWATEEEQQPEITGILFLTALVILIVLMVLIAAGGVFLAVRNLRLGRGDRKGAFRLAAFVFSLRLLHWALSGDHVGHPLELIPLTIAFCGATALALLAWIVYVACEPYVRRLWPQTMVSWSRVLAGRFRDPLVGRDVLVGCTFVSVLSVVFGVAFWIAERFGIVGVVPFQQPLVLIRGGRFAVGELFNGLLIQTCFALGIMMIFLLFRMICRKTWIAATLLCLIVGTVGALQMAGLFGLEAAAFFLILQATGMAVWIFVLLRFGLLALVAYSIFDGVSQTSMFTYNTSAPYFGTGLFVTLIAFAFVAYGFRTSLAGRPLLRDSILDH